MPKCPLAISHSPGGLCTQHLLSFQQAPTLILLITPHTSPLGGFRLEMWFPPTSLSRQKQVITFMPLYLTRVQGHKAHESRSSCQRRLSDGKTYMWISGRNCGFSPSPAVYMIKTTFKHVETLESFTKTASLQAPSQNALFSVCCLCF